MRRALLTSLILAGVLLATLPLWAEEPGEPAPAPAPAPGAEDATIRRLVEDLGSSDFAKREQASRELLALGEQARPVLERTMKSSDNMEARWRAEQILRRMDREGERSMGQESAPPPPRAPSGLDELERRIEALRRRMFDGAGPRAFGAFGPSSERLEVPGLRLDAEVFTGVLVQVTLLDRAASRAYRGRTLEDVLARSPELEKRDGMPKLKEKWAAFKQANPSLFRPGFSLPRPGSGFSFSQGSQGVEVVHDAEGVTVRIRETDENGEEQVTEIKGRTLDEIKEEHPELRDRLERFGIHIQLGPVQIFRRRPADPGLPVPPETETTPANEAGKPAIFGVLLVVPEPVLAVHLGLEPGHGALVTRVVPGTQAAEIGLERYDVIVSVRGEAVTDFHEAAALLRAAARERAPLSLDVIRRGKRTTLER